MKQPEYVQVFIRLQSQTTGAWLAPPALREKLVADADAAGTNLTTVALSILADAFSVECDLSKRRTAPDVNGTELNLRVPMKLYRRIAASAARTPRTVQREVVSRLCSHYSLDEFGVKGLASGRPAL